MTKKDFIAIAKVINGQKQHRFFNIPVCNSAFDDAKEDIAKSLADYFVLQNSRFNRQKFIIACTND